MILELLLAIAIEPNLWMVKTTIVETYNVGKYLFYGEEKSDDEQLLKQIEELKNENETFKNEVEKEFDEAREEREKARKEREEIANLCKMYLGLMNGGNIEKKKKKIEEE